MSTPLSPPQGRGPAGGYGSGGDGATGRRGSEGRRGAGSRRGYGARATDADPGLRVSDAERTEVADRLAEHYGDGRLDEAEFNERLDRAMKAKTHADLARLFADLPGGQAPGTPPPRRDRHPLRRFALIVLIIVVAAAVGHALAESWILWLLAGVLVLIWMRRSSARHRVP